MTTKNLRQKPNKKKNDDRFFSIISCKLSHHSWPDCRLNGSLNDQQLQVWTLDARAQLHSLSQHGKSNHVLQCYLRYLLALTSFLRKTIKLSQSQFYTRLNIGHFLQFGFFFWQIKTQQVKFVTSATTYEETEPYLTVEGLFLENIIPRIDVK